MGGRAGGTTEDGRLLGTDDTVKVVVLERSKYGLCRRAAGGVLRRVEPPRLVQQGENSWPCAGHGFQLSLLTS
jgi:hypothetical protein